MKSAAACTHTSVRTRASPGIVAVATAWAPSLRYGQDADQRAKDMACATTPLSSGVAPPGAPPGSRPGLPGPRAVAGYAEIWLGCHQSGSTAGWGPLQLVPGRDGECVPATSHPRATWQGHRGDQRDQWPDFYSWRNG